MTYHEACDAAKAKGLVGWVEKRPASWPVGKEFGGKFGMARKRIVAALGPLTGRPSKAERNYRWVVEVKCDPLPCGPIENSEK